MGGLLAGKPGSSKGKSLFVMKSEAFCSSGAKSSHCSRFHPFFLRPAAMGPEPLLGRFADARFHEFVHAPHAAQRLFVRRRVVVEWDWLDAR